MADQGLPQGAFVLNDEIINHLRAAFENLEEDIPAGQLSMGYVSAS